MTFLSEISPQPTPETQTFWEGVERNLLLVQQCLDCGKFFHPPGIVCPACTSRRLEWVKASGKATLYSYVITHRPWPQWNREGPMSVALVKLEEGPLLVSTIVDCEQTPDVLQLDAGLRAVFRQFGDKTKLLCFRLDNGTTSPT